MCTNNTPKPFWHWQNGGRHESWAVWGEQSMKGVVQEWKGLGLNTSHTCQDPIFSLPDMPSEVPYANQVQEDPLGAKQLMGKYIKRWFLPSPRLSRHPSSRECSIHHKCGHQSHQVTHTWTSNSNMWKVTILSASRFSPLGSTFPFVLSAIQPCHELSNEFSQPSIFLLPLHHSKLFFRSLFSQVAYVMYLCPSHRRLQPDTEKAKPLCPWHTLPG